MIKDGWDEDPEARLTAANIMVRLENLIGMRAKLDPLPPQISTTAEGQGEFLSPVSEVSQSSCNKVHMSASFSGSTSVLAIPPPPPPFHHGRFSVDHGNNATTASMIISLNDLQARYREEMAAANVTGNGTNIVATATFDSLPSPPPPPPPPPPDASCTITTPSAEASSTSDQQDKVNTIDATTGQPQRLSDPQQDASISISVS